MSTRPQALFLSHRIPYPPDKGDKIRSWHLLKHLTTTHRVHLVCFADDKNDLRHEDFLKSQLESVHIELLSPVPSRLKSAKGFLSGTALSFEYFKDQNLQAMIDKIRSLPLDLEIVFSSAMAPYIKTPIENRLRIVDFCDADSEKFLDYAQSSHWPMSAVYKREGRLVSDQETCIANWVDASFAITADEAAIFNRRSTIQNPVDWWSNGVDADYFDPTGVIDDPGKKYDVVFVGAMDYRANVEAVETFISQVWPEVRRAAPDLSFAIVGRNPVGKILKLNGVDSVHVTGAVDDVRPWLKSAKIVVAPLRVARGIQNKVLEAMSMAKPVIATPQAMTGIDCPEEAVCECSGHSEMSEAILALLAMPERRAQMGELARKAVLKNYSWPARLRRFDDLVAKLRRDHHSSSSLAKSA